MNAKSTVVKFVLGIASRKMMGQNLFDTPSRNGPCFCGSGKRFKHCHGALSINRTDAPIENWHQTPQHVREAFDRQQIERAKHYRNGNFHRPFLITGDSNNRFIKCGGRVFHWGGGGTFLNFLEAHLLSEVGEAIRNDEAHPLHVWREAMRAQAKARLDAGHRGRVMSTVATMNFFTVAHDLFVVADNAKLRDRLLKSLRKAHEFQGARYELMVASCLVRAGFLVEFSNESDLNQKHPDATVHHPGTGRRYTVEMKAKGRPGLLGKPGTPPSPEEMRRDVSRLIRAALEKPAEDERLIFIDMNLPPAPPPLSKERVWWKSDAISSIEAIEAQPDKIGPNSSALIIFTNLPSYQMSFDDYNVGLELAFTGFRKPDFATMTTLLGERYPDIACLFDAFREHDLVPDSLW